MAAAAAGGASKMLFPSRDWRNTGTFTTTMLGKSLVDPTSILLRFRNPFRSRDIRFQGEMLHKSQRESQWTWLQWTRVRQLRPHGMLDVAGG